MRIAPVWSDALPPAFPRLERSMRCDVAIVGGGLAGLSAAYHLLMRRPGAKVVVLEASRVGAGASGRSTGMLGPGVGQSLPALVKSRGAEVATALYRATLQAVDDVEALVKAERIECELVRGGQLVVGRSGSEGRLAELASTLSALGLPGQVHDAAQLSLRIRLTQATGAVLIPDAATLHPGKLLAALAARVVALGGEIFEGARVESISHDSPVRLSVHPEGISVHPESSSVHPESISVHPESISVHPESISVHPESISVHPESSRGMSRPGAASPLGFSRDAPGPTEVLADQVVLATAGYTSNLKVLHGRILPVHLQVLVTDPVNLDALGWKNREGVLDARRVFNYFRLTSDNRIVFGGGAPRYQWGGSLTDNADAPLRALERELHATFPTKLKVAGGWTGVIGYVADALPAISRWSQNPAVIHAVGWCGHGVALSIASGAWVTRLLCDQTAEEDLPWYRPDPPRVPFEAARWLGFNATVAAMGMLDHL